MPQFFAIVLAGAGLWAGYKWLKKETSRVADDLKRAEEQLARRGEHAALRGDGDLVLDPDTGVYKPRQTS